MTNLIVLQGDITTIPVDAMVNAANRSLLGGGGVDGAIHRAAGPDLLRECKTLGGCETGNAKLTQAYRLPAKYVIHAVGPEWSGGTEGEAEKLASCYRRSLELAVQHHVKTLSFPAISCGIYAFPIPQAAQIAIREVRSFIARDAHLQEIYHVCFGQDVYQAYQRALGIASE